MWFPYSLPTKWKPEAEAERINDSFADKRPREFLVAFQLRNPVSREWSVELQLNEPKWVLKEDADTGAISVGYYPNEQERLAEIICKLEDTDVHGAVRRCFALVGRVLSHWAANYGRGLAIGGMRIADLDHEARWRVLPHRPSAQDFYVPNLEALPENFWGVAGLYREARSATSDRYRFLCCYSIVTLWARGDEPFDAARSAQGTASPAASLQVTKEMMVHSGMEHFLPHLEGTPLAELPDRLKDWRESALRTVLEGDAPGSAGNYEHTFELIAVANLVDLAAHQILAQELDRREPAADDGSQTR